MGTSNILRKSKELTKIVLLVSFMIFISCESPVSSNSNNQKLLSNVLAQQKKVKDARIKQLVQMVSAIFTEAIVNGI